MFSFSRLFIPVFVAFAAVLIMFFSLPDPSNEQNPINPDKLTGEYDQSDVQGVFHESPVVAMLEEEESTTPVILGDTDQLKRIEVDLTTQTLYAYEGDQKIYEFIISSGKWGKTPAGTFQIWGKFKYTKMSGGSKELGTYYYLPNVPSVMFYSNDQVAASRGFSIHGAYWHDNFGHPMSHGCINMRVEEAAVLFDWAEPSLGDKKSGRSTKDNPGTEVIVYGVAPKN